MRSAPTSDSGSRASDGGASGFFAVGLLYGPVKQTKSRRPLMRLTYLQRCGTRVALGAALRGLGLSGKRNTAFIEPVNLTLRQSVAALARRRGSTLQEAPQLLLQLEWWRATITSCGRTRHSGRRWPSHESGVASARGNARRQRRVALAAGLTRRRSPVHELLAIPLASEPRGIG